MAKKETKTVKAVKNTEETTKETTVEKIEAKPKKKKAASKTTAAKETTKRLTTAKEPKKIAMKEEVKKPEEKTPVIQEKEKKAVKKTTAAKKTTVKATKEKKAVSVKKTETKEEAKAEPKKKTATKKTEPKAVKKTTKKAGTKKTAQTKMERYAALPLEECIRLMQTMKVQYEYEDYYRLLMEEADLSKLAKGIIDGNKLKEQKVTFEKDGCDADLVLVTLHKVADTMDVKAADYKEIKKTMNKAVKYQMKEDAEANAAEYLDEFKLSEKLLMIGQRKDIHDTKEISTLVGADVIAFYRHFFEFAYELLPSWQYNDVKFYEDFAYAVLSQFTDLFQEEQLRIQIDAADLYIKHGDYQHGDEMYGYILRDNQIKDYIYYRYASVYKDIDYNKAKAIAYSSLQYVDDRYTYYPNIMEIVNS